MIKKLGLVFVFLVLIVLAVTSVASARGTSPAQLTSAGWMCFNVPGLGVHCFSPGAFRSSSTIQVQVFDTTDPGDTDADMVATELLILDSLYRGQPCPQEGGGEYDLLLAAETGLPADYRACHHR